MHEMRRGEFHLDPPDDPIVPEPAPERIHHPAITAPAYLCYRVVRRYRQRGGFTEVEDIGAFHSPLQAADMLAKEIGRAQVLDPRGKVWADNLQPIEER
jgi:hypothetical protein